MFTRRGVAFGGVACALVLALCVTACGSGEPVVVRVGEQAITRSMLTHWMAVMGAGHGRPDRCYASARSSS
jgi:hypothetical protein